MKNKACDQTVNTFISAVYPNHTRLSASCNTEETILQDATELINSMRNALFSIANMQITKTTNKDEVLALCMSIAKIEILK